jgi:hypothetical protein
MQPSDVPSPDAESVGPRARFAIRYDDLTQQGHVKQVTLQLGLGQLCFDKLWSKHPLFETRKQGVAAILSRLVLESEPVAVSMGAPLEATGQIEVAHERTIPGHPSPVSALFMNATADIWGLPSRRQAGVDVATRSYVRIGRAFGEHVLTKPFGPPSERKVLRFEVPGQPALPEAEHTRIRVDQNARLPEGAIALDKAFLPDESRWVFGLVHTDLNQHVNSLVYARMFEEAALRRAARHRQLEGLAARKLSLCYRKPCFAGQSMTCMLQSYQLDGVFGAIGYVGPAGAPLAKAHCSFQLQFRRL